MKRKLFFLVGIAMPFLICCGQSSDEPLVVGQPMPDYIFNHVLNYPDSNLTISEQKGKVVILDFWSVVCGSCKKDIPVLHRLQKAYPSELQVILVNIIPHTLDKETTIKQYLEDTRIRLGDDFSIPSAIDTSQALLPLIPHMYVPHYVWIGKDGKIIAITSSEEITDQNVKAAINGTLHCLPIKNDFIHQH